MKAGDIVEITKCPENYEFFSVGDAAILTRLDEGGDWWAMFGDAEWCIQGGISECRMIDSSPITTECDALREEIEMLAAENRRLLNEVAELRKYPEAAVRAVWEHGLLTGVVGWSDTALSTYEHHAEEVSRVLTEALQKG